VQTALEQRATRTDTVDFERHDELATGVTPKAYDCSDVAGLSGT